MHYDNTLYIIGNGFDLYHGASSSYSEFKNYVKRKDYGSFLELEDFFMPHDLWSSFAGGMLDELLENIRNSFHVRTWVISLLIF